jgi:glycosyltransferase involved in cell wall biosynthesis
VTTILYGAFYPQLGGAELTLLGLLDEVVRERVRPIVLVAGEGPLVDALRQRSIPVLVEPRMRVITRHGLSAAGIAAYLGTYAGVVRALARALGAHRVDLVHVFVAAALGYAGRAAHAEGVPVVGTVHEPLGAFAWPRRRRLVAALNRLCDRVTVPSAANREAALRHGVRADRLAVVHGGIDVERFRPEPDAARRGRDALGVPPGAPLVGMVARFGPGKGHEVLLRAMALVADADPEARCVLVGDALFAGEAAWKARMLTLTRTLGLDGRVTFAGWRDDMPAVLSAIDVLVHPPTTPDSLPAAVLEGMAAGRPVIGARIGGVPELVEHGLTGCLVPPGSVEELARALRGLLGDPGARAAMGAAGRRRVAAGFSRERFGRAMTDVYASVLAARRGSA